MGQRHQQFIRTLNPANYGHYTDSFDFFDKRKKTVILPFHNQWLYGRSAPLSALRVLEHAASIDEKARKGIEQRGYYGDSSPFGLGGLTHYNNRGLEGYLSKVEHILNYSQKGDYGVVMPGFGGSFFLERGDKEYYKLMAKNFTMGDNNDGVTIIDTLNLKYCFMNISNYHHGDEGPFESVSDLPYLKPVGAMEYMSAYYPINYSGFSTYSKEEKGLSKSDLNDIALENSKVNTEIAERFYPFEVMTLDEVKKIFPRVYETKGSVIK